MQSSIVHTLLLVLFLVTWVVLLLNAKKMFWIRVTAIGVLSLFLAFHAPSFYTQTEYHLYDTFKPDDFNDTAILDGNLLFNRSTWRELENIEVGEFVTDSDYPFDFLGILACIAIYQWYLCRRSATGCTLIICFVSVVITQFAAFAIALRRFNSHMANPERMVESIVGMTTVALYISWIRIGSGRCCRVLDVKNSVAAIRHILRSAKNINSKPPSSHPDTPITELRQGRARMSTTSPYYGIHIALFLVLVTLCLRALERSMPIGWVSPDVFVLIHDSTHILGCCVAIISVIYLRQESKRFRKESITNETRAHLISEKEESILKPPTFTISHEEHEGKRYQPQTNGDNGIAIEFDATEMSKLSEDGDTKDTD